MKTSNLGYFTLSYFASSASAAIAFAACGASQPPIGAPGATPQSRATMKIKALDLKSFPPNCVERNLPGQELTICKPSEPHMGLKF